LLYSAVTLKGRTFGATGEAAKALHEQNNKER
jgi:hypothetical protein